jgi:hypothetical protein
MIYKDESLSEFIKSTRGKRIAIYGDSPKYNVMEMRYADVAEIIGVDIDYIIKRDNNTNIEKTFINCKEVLVYPSLRSFQTHQTSKNLVISASMYTDLHSLHQYAETNFDKSYFKDVETYFLPFLINRPLPYELSEPTGVQKIPKIIHYCWFGDKPIPPLYLDCIESWKKFNPDYEIKFWNEKNYDIDANPLAKLSYIHKNYGDVSDRARLEFVEKYGGIYMDCDVQLFKPLDRFLHNEIFFSTINNRNICSEVPFGATPNNPLMKRIRRKHDSTGIGYKAFYEITSSWKNVPYYNPEYDLMIYPSDVFAPTNDFCLIETFTNNTHGVHHRGNCWIVDKFSKNKQEDLKAGRLKNMEFIASLFGKHTYQHSYKTIYDRL